MATHSARRTFDASNRYASADILKVRRRIFTRDSVWPWVIAISVFLIVMVLGNFTLSMALSVGAARGKASIVMDNAKAFVSAAKHGDKEKLEASAQQVSDAAHGIQDELDSSVWEFASRLPIVGTDIEDVRILADVLVDVSDNALVPMSQSGNILALDTLTSGDSMDFSALPGILAALDEAMPALNRSARTLESLPPASIPPLANLLDSASETIVNVDDFLVRIRPLFPYLPELMGANEERHYLVLAQNNAEIHSIGGFVGAFGILTMSNGDMDMGEFQDLARVLAHEGDPSGATEEEIATFGDRCDSHHGDHNVIPDFSRVGQLYFNSWNIYQDYEVDGVIGVDVMFLQYLLDAFGSIETSYGLEVDGSNCAAVLLNQSLFWWQSEKCDVLYREVASEALSRVFGNMEDVDITKLIKAVTKGAAEDRLSVWMRDEEIEDTIKATGFGGELKHDETTPVLGVYVSDASVSKMSYYLSCDVDLSEPRMNDDGSQTYDVEVTYTNNFDPNARDVFPKYIQVGNKGRDNMDLGEQVYMFAPEGGFIEDITCERVNTREGTPNDSEWREVSYQGLNGRAATLRIDAGESAIVRFKVTTSPNVVEPLKVRKSPLMPPEYAYWNEDLSKSNPSWNIEKTI